VDRDKSGTSPAAKAVRWAPILIAVPGSNADRAPEQRKKLLAPAVGCGYSPRMANGSTTALERLLRPLSQTLTLELARALVGVQADAETQSRYDQLAAQRTEGQLTPDEQAELESMVRANTLLGVLKAEAHAFLAHTKTA
jgi:hypothetical protein